MKQIKEFWYTDKGQLKIDDYKFKRFLEDEGIYKNAKTGELILIEGKFIEEIEDHQMIALVETVLVSNGYEEVLSAVVKKVKALLNKNYLKFLKPITVMPIRDHKELIRLYFINGCVEISKDKVEYINYRKFNGHIHKSQVISFKLNKHYIYKPGTSDYEAFISNLAGGDHPVRFEHLQQLIGFMIHTYKNPSQSLAVIITDSTKATGSEANGGTGKTLLVVAVSKIRPTLLRKDGKNLKQKNNQFFFQDIGRDTEILYYDDVRQNFNLEFVYSAITEGITVEKKYKAPYTIHAKDSPKIIITSNYSVTGTGGFSEERRRVDFEVSPYYGRNRKPEEEFGHLFFDDWNYDQWNAFYHYMIRCCQLYLQKGVPEPKPINLQYNRLVAETCWEFAEFASTIPINERIEKNKLIDQYKELHSDEEYLFSNTFTKYMQVFAEIYGYNYKRIKSNGKTFYLISSNKLNLESAKVHL